MPYLQHETYWEHKQRLEDRIQKNASAFLQKCRSEGFTVYDVEKTIEKAQQLMELYTDLQEGLQLPDQS